MLLTTPSKQLIGIIGLPRSGTTILSNLFNSCENGFCMIEPIWAKECGMASIYESKNGKVELSPPEEIPDKARLLIKGNGFGAIKETYRLNQKKCAEVLYEKCDSLVFTVRNPLTNFASWKRTGWGEEYLSRPYFIENYESLINDIETVGRQKPISVLIHEDLCDKKYEYFNKCCKLGQLQEIFKLTGVKSPYGFGDERAANSIDFTETNDNIDSLVRKDIGVINRFLFPLYDKLRKSIIIAAIVIGILCAKWVVRLIAQKNNEPITECIVVVKRRKAFVEQKRNVIEFPDPSLV